MDKKRFSIMSAAVGAGLMFLLDPDKGKRRRALIRDQLTHFKHKMTGVINAKTQDARNRGLGLIARSRRVFEADKVSEDALAAKVRRVVQEKVSDPGAIETQVENGRVILSGNILDEELPVLLESVQRLDEVSTIDNRLRIPASTDRSSPMQSETVRLSKTR